jgi:hypothetical protein
MVLVVGAIVFLALLAVGLWLMGRAGTEPATRGVGRAADPAEEREARERPQQESGILVEGDRERQTLG